MDHFENPRNVGELSDANGVAEVGNPECGDVTKIFLKIEDNIIKDIKFKTFGCAAAVASSSMLTEMAKGMPVDEALKITDEAVAEMLGGLPAQKMHCSNMAADAMHAAVEDYRKRQGV
jgi:nitrogen fixation NifU-like protein